MIQITVKSIKPQGFYEKTFEVDESDYEKLGEVAMEAMTRAVEEVVEDCKDRVSGNSTSSRAFIKHFFSSFGPLIWSFKKKDEDDPDAHYSTLTELALRNAGYSNLSSLVSKCTQALNKDIEKYDDESDLDELDSDDDGEHF